MMGKTCIIDESSKIKDSNCGENVKVYKNVIVKESSIGDNVTLGDMSIIDHAKIDGYSEIGRRVLVKKQT